MTSTDLCQTRSHDQKVVDERTDGDAWKCRRCDEEGFSEDAETEDEL